MTFLTRFWPWLSCILAGLAMVLCFPPFQLSDFVWVAPVLLLAPLWSERRPSRKRQLLALGFLSGMVFWSLNLKWIATVAGAGYLVLCVYLSVYFALFSLFAGTVGNPFARRAGSPNKPEELSPAAKALRSLGFAALNAGVWSGLEWLRGWLFTGFGWNGLGVAFHNKLPMAQGAELVGVYGLSFLPVFLGAVLVQAGKRVWRTAKEGRTERHWDFLVTVVSLAIIFVLGMLRIGSINKAETSPLQVLLVQADVPQSAFNPAMTPDEIIEALEEETVAGLAAVEKLNEERIAQVEQEVELESVDWVIWPEVVLYPILTANDERSWLTIPTEEVVTRLNALGVRTFIAGLNEWDAEVRDGQPVPIEGGKQYNTMAAFEGDEFSSYRKQHLVIYGEFIPFSESSPIPGKIYELVAGIAWPGNMGRGVGAEGFELGGAGGDVAVIPSICFEDTVPRVTRKFSKETREVIVNITNDGWFGTSEGSAQHFANALFRSIELRRPMMRSANRGVTGVVSATGSLVDYQTGRVQALFDDEGKPFARGSLHATVRVPEEGGRTIYARFGDWFPALGLMVAAGWSAWFFLRERRSSRHR